MQLYNRILWQSDVDSERNHLLGHFAVSQHVWLSLCKQFYSFLNGLSHRTGYWPMLWGSVCFEFQLRSYSVEEFLLRRKRFRRSIGKAKPRISSLQFPKFPNAPPTSHFQAIARHAVMRKVRRSLGNIINSLTLSLSLPCSQRWYHTEERW